MGSVSGAPRSGMRMAIWGAEHLGWNIKWVTGYPGSPDLVLALERGEIEMTSTANLFLIQKLLATGKFKLLVQTGTLKQGVAQSRPDFGDTPTLAKLMEGKIHDPLARAAFDYWSNISSIDKWLALPPRTPSAMLAAYRDAYGRMVQDPEFIERGKRTSDDFVPMSSAEVETMVRALGATPAAAFDYTGALLKKQGLPTG
jgi:hypothetical protein